MPNTHPIRNIIEARWTNPLAGALVGVYRAELQSLYETFRLVSRGLVQRHSRAAQECQDHASVGGCSHFPRTALQTVRSCFGFLLLKCLMTSPASFPVVLHQYFVETYAEPTYWMAARKAFSTSAAVMSMVGYIVG